MSTKELTEAEQVAQLEQYMLETKKALKPMSKNDLIRAVSALLLDKRILINQLNRLNAQIGVNNVQGSDSIPAATQPAITGE